MRINKSISHNPYIIYIIFFIFFLLDRSATYLCKYNYNNYDYDLTFTSLTDKDLKFMFW